MREALQFGAILIGLPLQFLIIMGLLRGEYKRYPFIFIYVIADLVGTVLSIQPSLAYSSGTPAQKKQFARLFWEVDWVMQGLVFLLVISLVYTASKYLRPRRTLLTATVCGTILFAGISFWAEYIPNVA